MRWYFIRWPRMVMAASGEATISTQPVSGSITHCAHGLPLGTTPLESRQSRPRITLEHRHEFRQAASMPAGPSSSPRASVANPSIYSRELRVTHWHAKASAERWNRSAVWLSGRGGLVRPLTYLYVTRSGGGCSDANRLYIRVARLSASANWGFPR